MKIIIGIILALFALIVSVLIATGVSVCVLWVIDTICGTDFYTWENIGILSIVLFILDRGRDGKN